MRRDRRVVPGHFDFAAHHLAPARVGGEKHDEVVGFADLSFDFLCPRLPDRQPLIDEDGAAGLFEAADQFTRQRLVGLDVSLVAEEDARNASLDSLVDCVHRVPRRPSRVRR